MYVLFPIQQYGATMVACAWCMCQIVRLCACDGCKIKAISCQRYLRPPGETAQQSVVFCCTVRQRLLLYYSNLFSVGGRRQGRTTNPTPWIILEFAIIRKMTNHQQRESMRMSTFSCTHLASLSLALLVALEPRTFNYLAFLA